MAPSCELSPSEQDQIQQWVTAHGTPQQVALRCQIVLAAAEGQSDVAIAEQLSVNRKTVVLWRTRFSEQRAGPDLTRSAHQEGPLWDHAHDYKCNGTSPRARKRKK